MATPSPKQVAGWTVGALASQQYTPLDSAIILALQNSTQMSNEVIADYAEENLAKVVEELHRVTQVRIEQEGIEPEFSLIEDGGIFLVRPEPREYIPYRKLLLQMTDSEFEQYCVDVLRKLGSRAERCGGTNDAGIDFFGFNLPIHATMPVSLAAGIPNILLGQAKRYAPDNFVSEKEIRVFIGSAINKHNEFIRRSQASILTPTILTYWTTSDFTAPARNLCRNHGIWCLSGFAAARIGLIVNIFSSSP